MYGLVNQGVQDFASSLGGDALWRRIRAAAGVDDEAFISANPYDDDVTYRLVGAASRILEVPPEEVLRGFGRHWILYTARRGYGSMFDTMGRTIEDFLGNLDAMHTRLSLTMPELRPPSFVCDASADGRIRIEYRSERDGLAPMVVGLLEGLIEMYSLDASVEHTMRRGDDGGHDEFVIRPSDPLDVDDGVTRT